MKISTTTHTGLLQLYFHLSLRSNDFFFYNYIHLRCVDKTIQSDAPLLIFIPEFHHMQTFARYKPHPLQKNTSTLYSREVTSRAISSTRSLASRARRSLPISLPGSSAVHQTPRSRNAFLTRIYLHIYTYARKGQTRVWARAKVKAPHRYIRGRGSCCCCTARNIVIYILIYIYTRFI